MFYEFENFEFQENWNVFLENSEMFLGLFLFFKKHWTRGCGPLPIIIFQFLHECKNNPHQIPGNILQKIITFFSYFPTIYVVA